ncbi:hypothetical protein HanRHA438_Chr07g0319391 [Helianthus annuus]|nr:hypothetical protein HanRHA438_Chr07g0319391 [Helianthus annuus]
MYFLIVTNTYYCCVMMASFHLCLWCLWSIYYSCYYLVYYILSLFYSYYYISNLK